MRNLVTTTERIKLNAFVEHPGALAAFETTEQTARRRLDEMLNEALMDSFPASDPISSLQLA
ncbi:hypothetical protein [Tardiphaga sp. 709]|uniref:hypothetical protein n=1 Tax=unclassified Tardiphaga TaxID=2631404 RepID=UPI0028E95669|nr:hypothetical protein [Tardiphaga sp. 709]WNV08385.1 hypothetical protein RSO67_23265 [Tardiphaga sp. 709]